MFVIDISQLFLHNSKYSYHSSVVKISCIVMILFLLIIHTLLCCFAKTIQFVNRLKVPNSVKKKMLTKLIHMICCLSFVVRKMKCVVMFVKP